MRNKQYKQFTYISPLKDCKNENARLIASLVEQFMLDIVEVTVEFINVRTMQIYNEAEKLLKMKDRNNVN